MRSAPLAAAGLVALAACSAPPNPTAGIALVEQESGVTSGLRGLAVVDARTAWIGAPNGQVLRTVDGGANWQVLDVALAEGSDLRSAHGFSAEHALFATAGQPSRIIETRDGGASFQTVWQDPTGQAFIDSLTFWDDRNGLAFSDPVEGEFLILITQDGGANWTASTGTPDPLEGEAGFAASDTSIAVSPQGCAWIGTGGAATARVLRTCNWGVDWQAVETPMAAGSGGAGVFSVVWTGDRVVATGGDYQQPDARSGSVSWSRDGGGSWQSALEPPGGYRSAVAVLPIDPPALVSTGPNGSDISRNGAEIWIPWPELTGHNAIAFAPDGSAGWAVGSEGRITRIELP